MTSYRYSGRDKVGFEVQGQLDAPSAEDAALQLSRRGIIPLEITTEKAPSVPFVVTLKKGFKRKRATTEDLINFCQQMHTFYKAGIPIVSALKNILETTNKNKHMSIALKTVIVDLESGNSFASALAKHPAIFPNLLINIVQVGETSGQLDEALNQVSQYLEMEDVTVKQIRSATRYPILVIAFVTIAIVILNIFVIPTFAKVFSAYGSQLPLLTRFLLSTSAFMINYWWILLIGIVLLYVGLIFCINTHRGRYIWDGLKLKVPVFGPIIQRVLFARLSRCFVLILRTNILLSKGIELTAEAADNAYVREHILEARVGLSHGESILAAVRKTTLFPPFILQMMMVGEQTGAIDTMLLHVAVFYEREVAYQLKRAGDLMEPILLFFIGIIVLILALGIFLPMWDLPNLVLKK